LFYPQWEEGLKWGIVLLVSQNPSTRIHADRPRRPCVELSEKEGSTVESFSEARPRSREVALLG
jgi:hypothetical protein